MWDGIMTFAEENKSPILKSHYMRRHTCGLFLPSMLWALTKQPQDQNFGGTGHQPLSCGIAGVVGVCLGGKGYSGGVGAFTAQAMAI